MSLTRGELTYIRDTLLDVWLDNNARTKEAAGTLIDKIEDMLKPKPRAEQPREFWMTYDAQTGRWCVQETPFEVVRFDSVIHHVQVMDTEVIGER